MITAAEMNFGNFSACTMGIPNPSVTRTAREMKELAGGFLSAIFETRLKYYMLLPTLANERN